MFHRLATATPFDGTQARAFEGENTEHAVIGAVDPFLDLVFAPFTWPERIADQIAEGWFAAFLQHFEASVIQADQLAAAAQGLSLSQRRRARQGEEQRCSQCTHMTKTLLAAEMQCSGDAAIGVSLSHVDIQQVNTFVGQAAALDQIALYFCRSRLCQLTL